MSGKNVVVDFFSQAPGFIEAFKKVCQQGFFSTLTVYFDLYGPRSPYRVIKIDAVGYVPDDEKNMEKGVTPFFDPSVMVDNVRNQIEVEGFIFKNATCKVEVKKWDEMDEEGNFVGKLGLEFNLNAFLNLVNPELLPEEENEE